MNHALVLILLGLLSIGSPWILARFDGVPLGIEGALAAWLAEQDAERQDAIARMFLSGLAFLAAGVAA